MTTVNRETLLKIINLVRPALSTQNFVPALMHFLFSAGNVTAFNDVTAITVKAPKELAGLECCLPGDLLVRALNSLSTESVALKEVDSNTVLITSGRSRIKVPMLPVEDFPLKPFSADAPDAEFDVTEFFLTGVRLCLIGVGTDPTHPAQMGVTVETEGGTGVLYSTDNVTISRFDTGDKMVLPADAPVILPTFFCEQLLTLAKAFPSADVSIEVWATHVVAHIGKQATLLTRTLVDLEPLDFGSIVSKHCDVKKVKREARAMPMDADEAWARALMVTQTEVDKFTKVSLNDDGDLRLYSESGSTSADDVIELDDSGAEAWRAKPFNVDPALVVRITKAKVCTAAVYYPRVMVLVGGADDRLFMHLIAHCA